MSQGSYRLRRARLADRRQVRVERMLCRRARTASKTAAAITDAALWAPLHITGRMLQRENTQSHGISWRIRWFWFSGPIIQSDGYAGSEPAVCDDHKRVASLIAVGVPLRMLELNSVRGFKIARIHL